MQQEALERFIVRGAERWKAIKDRQYQLQLPSGVYTTDLPISAVLALVEGDDDEVVARITDAAEVLARLRTNPAVSGILAVGADVAAVLALAALPEEMPVPVSVAATIVPDVVVPAAPELAQPVVQEASVVVIGCEHVGSDGKCATCTGDRVVECASCDNNVIAAKGHACRNSGSDDCDRIYCDDCEDNLNERGYCEDCATVQCDGCDEHIDRGTEKRCGGTNCDQGYCEDCVDRLFNAAGLCPSCSGEEEMECSACDEGCFTESRLTQCKDSEECEHQYCDACKVTALSEQGYCDDCMTVECSYCDDGVVRGSEKKCQGNDCDRIFCEECAVRLLSETGQCAECLGEEEEDCSDCGETFVSLRLKGCKKADDCGNAYCSECREANLVNGRCGDCRDA